MYARASASQRLPDNSAASQSLVVVSMQMDAEFEGPAQKVYVLSFCSNSTYEDLDKFAVVQILVRDHDPVAAPPQGVVQVQALIQVQALRRS